MNEIDQIEQELSDLKQRFAQSAQVLEELTHVKQQFSELSQTYQAFQSTLGQSEAADARLSQIESQLETRCEQLQAQLTNFRFDFDATNRQLHEKFEKEHQELTRIKQSQSGTSTHGDDGDRLQWLESSLQHFNSTIYADRAALQKLERSYRDLKRMVDIMAMVGAALLFGLILITLIFK